MFCLLEFGSWFETKLILCETKETDRTKISPFKIVIFANKRMKILHFFRQSFEMKHLLRNHIVNFFTIRFLVHLVPL